MDYEPMKHDEMDSDTRKEVGQLKKNIDKKQNPLRKVIMNAMKTAVITMLAKMLPILIGAAIIITLISGFQILLDGSGEDAEKDTSYEEDLQYASTVADLTTYLYQFSHGSAGPPQSEDGKYYKMFDDGAGIPTIGASDLNWNVNKSKFDKEGMIRTADGEEKQVNVKEYVDNILDSRGSKSIDECNIFVAKEMVDEIGGETAQGFYDEVLAATNAAGITLSQQQLYALTEVRAAGFSPSKGAGLTDFTRVYLEGAEKYPIDSDEHNMYIWDNFWCKLGTILPGNVKGRDASFETYTKGVFDFYSGDTLYNELTGITEGVGVFGRTKTVFYTEEQLLAKNEELKEGSTKFTADQSMRTSSNEEKIFTYKEIDPTHFDGDTVIAAGYNFPHYLQYNFDGSYGSSTISASGCGPTSVAMILAGLCNDYSITPITFIATMNKYYNGDWTNYYLPGAGSYHYGICNSAMLQKYYNCKSTSVSSEQQALDALAAGKCVEASDDGHIYAVIPVPNEYRSAGYKFYILDSALGFSGAYKSLSEFTSKTGRVLSFKYIIEPI